MYTAVLIKGKTYAVKGHVFHLNQEKEIEKKVFQYLDGNEFFDCQEVKTSVDDPKTDEPEKEEEEPVQEAKTYTETELKDMKKDGQEAVIVDLGGDPSEFKNEGERIAFILENQEQQEKTGE
ncbi:MULTISPECIES: YqbF domain-containing protein [Bacillus]|uniref:YqbF domain-containing protein n=1 Tax=Bacillus TaxID=1386 RepID=UPI00061A456B|nr:MULTISPECIES: YqbF domain-containing protein [Bacillus]AKC65582.1 hypothetical protein VT48_05995 [Bacillus altitudinis]QTV13667.1 YqbF domain-containing protein [Bacillus altitudinis]